jgi:surface protein
MPDLLKIVLSFCGDVIYSQAQDEFNEVTFATAEKFRKSKAINCYFINYEITSTDHIDNPDIPKTLLRCSGIPKIKTHTLACMFCNSEFNGDISQWDVSNVINMQGMFYNSQFNNPSLLTWDVSNVTTMRFMFKDSKFNGDLSKWNVSNVTDMVGMFYNSQFNNPSLLTWDVSSVTTMFQMFNNSLFNRDISQWDVSNVTNTDSMFYRATIKKNTVQTWVNFKKNTISMKCLTKLVIFFFIKIKCQLFVILFLSFSQRSNCSQLHLVKPDVFILRK